MRMVLFLVLSLGVAGAAHAQFQPIAPIPPIPGIPKIQGPQPPQAFRPYELPKPSADPFSPAGQAERQSW